jgi:phosphoribosylformylglycinamidine synthase PurS subunit
MFPNPNFKGGAFMDFEVLVQLKAEVLDPEARAIRDTLLAHGTTGIDAVTVTKRYVLSVSKDEPHPEDKIKKIADNYLANPVSQTYSIKRLGE